MKATQLSKKRNKQYVEQDKDYYALYHNPSLYQKIENIIFEILENKSDVDLVKLERQIFKMEKYKRWEDSTLPYLISLLKKHELIDEFIFQFKKILIRNMHLNYFKDFEEDIE